MLIDDLRGLDIHLEQVKIRDAVVFRIHETVQAFGDSHCKNNNDPLPSPLPYNNMVIHFDDICFWYISSAQGDIELLLQCSLFKSIDSYTHGEMPAPVIAIEIDKTSCDWLDGYIFNPYKEDGGIKLPESDHRIKQIVDMAYLVLQAFLNILSCKNIKTELEMPDKKVQQKRATKGKLPLVSYYTLKIQNIAHSKDSADSKGLWSNRIHFCRGHMREYTADAPMFGRLIGRYWTPPHMRGDKNKGIIIKDYEVDSKSG